MRIAATALALAAMVAIFTSCEAMGWGTPTQTPPPGVEFTSIELSDAVGRGLVEADIRGNGASSGDSIEAVFILLGNEALEISVPRGTVLAPSGSEQRMVITALTGVVAGSGSYMPASFITLWPGQEKRDTYLFEAYCLDFDKDNPSSSTGFGLTGPASEEVTAVLRCGGEGARACRLSRPRSGP
jgi:hypothetical protein